MLMCMIHISRPSTFCVLGVLIYCSENAGEVKTIDVGKFVHPGLAACLRR